MDLKASLATISEELIQLLEIQRKTVVFNNLK